MIRSLDEIKVDLKSENFVLSHHAYLRTVERNIQIDDIIECAENLLVIENYPDDKYSPSCLLLGFTNEKRPIHIQTTLDSSFKMKIITIYEPDLFNWTNNFKSRI